MKRHPITYLAVSLLAQMHVSIAAVPAQDKERKGTVAVPKPPTTLDLLKYQTAIRNQGLRRCVPTSRPWLPWRPPTAGQARR